MKAIPCQHVSRVRGENMNGSIANNIQSDFIFAFEEFIIEIFLSLGINKNELEAELMRLIPSGKKIISEGQIFKILAKIKLLHKVKENYISFSSDDDDDELSWNFEGPAFCYAKKGNLKSAN